MSEFQDINSAEVEQASATVRFARAYYAGALLAARHRPDDPHVQQRAEEARREYTQAAGKNGQWSRLEMPSEAC